MTEDRDFIEEITRINNELTNLQRELIKKKRNLEDLTEKLERSNIQLEAFINNIPDAIIILKENGSVLKVNQHFYSLYKSIIGTEFDITTNINNISTKNKFLDTIQEIISNKLEKKIQIESLKGEQWLELKSKQVIIPRSKEPISIIIQIRDITSFVRFNNLRNNFVSMVSHELKSPTTVIKLALISYRKLCDTLSYSEKEKLLNMVETNIESMIKLIEDLLEISQLESEQIELIKEKFYIKKKIEKLIEQLSLSVSKKKLKIQIEINPEIEIYADLQRFHQIFRIIIDNAIKYSRKFGNIFIKAENVNNVKCDLDNLEGVLIQIVDEGIGIKDIEIPRIFERFYRSSEVRNIEGSGLGLSIAKDLIQLHKGKIFVESVFGKGTTISVFFPTVLPN